MIPKWEKPKLVVLVKGMPEERVLAHCKYTGIGSSPNNEFANCVNEVGVECLICSDYAAS